jgi:hypothetical protein
MAMMLGALYRALIAGHVDEETARQAAEEVAAYDSRLATIEADVKVLKWMVGTNVVLTGGVLVRLFVA